VPGVRNVAYYDLNPTGKLHWANQLFLAGKQPDGRPTPAGYRAMRINPRDNAEHLPPGYIDNVLAELPPAKRARFLEGEWTDPEGVIFTDWREIEEVPEEVRLHSRHSYGIDFGFSVDPAAVVELWLNGDDLYVDEIIYETGLTNQALARRMDEEEVDRHEIAWADSAEPKSIEELRREGYDVSGALKGPDSVRAGIDWLLSKRVHVTRRSVDIWNERANYTWRLNTSNLPTAKPIDDYNHAMDAIRYGCSDWIDALHGTVAEWDPAALGL